MTVGTAQLASWTLAVVRALDLVFELTDIGGLAVGLAPHTELAATIAAGVALGAATLEAAYKRRLAVRVQAATSAGIEVLRDFAATRDDQECSGHASRDQHLVARSQGLPGGWQRLVLPTRTGLQVQLTGQSLSARHSTVQTFSMHTSSAGQSVE